jgi:hypothetical protein
VAGALLVTHEDVADRRVNQRVVDRQDGTAGEAEHDLRVLHLEALDEGLGSGQLHGFVLSRGVLRAEKNPRLGEGERTREGRACAT